MRARATWPPLMTQSSDMTQRQVVIAGLTRVAASILRNPGKHAAMEFPAVEEMRRLTPDERKQRMHTMLQDLRPWSVLAAEIAAMDKGELASKAARNRDLCGMGRPACNSDLRSAR